MLQIEMPKTGDRRANTMHIDAHGWRDTLDTHTHTREMRSMSAKETEGGGIKFTNR